MHTGGFQNMGNHLLHFLDVGLHQFPGPALFYKFKRYFHAGQGRAQFMTDIPQQLFLGGKHLVKTLGHGVEGLGQLAEFIRFCNRNPMFQIAATDFFYTHIQPLDRSQNPS